MDMGMDGAITAVAATTTAGIAAVIVAGGIIIIGAITTIGDFFHGPTNLCSSLGGPWGPAPRPFTRPAVGNGGAGDVFFGRESLVEKLED